MVTNPYRATSVASTGSQWNNVSDAFDDNDSTSYAYRDYYTTSACHINGFNITDLPSDAIINTVTAYFKAATENSYGYFAGFIMCDAKTGSSEYIKQSIFLNGQQQTSAQYYSMSVSGDELTNFATSNGLYGGSAVELLKNLRLRWVGGSTKGSAGLFNAYYCQCQVYDTYVVVDYTIPTYTLDLNGSLDGGDPNSNISNWGTADIYINGSIVSSSVSDYYESYTSGTTYEIKNIVAKSGYKYVGNSSYSGTLTSDTTIVLPFETTSTNMIYVGTKQPIFYIGTKQVQSIYLGMSLIYEVILPTISYDSIKTFGNLIVPSGETSNTYTLPAANLENAEGNISYALYSDNECTTSVGTGITFDADTRQVTVSNAAKDTVDTQDTDKDGLAKFYIKATYESFSAIGEITLENCKVTATFSYLNDKDEYADLQTEVYYGASVEEFANGITDYKLPENDKNCHYINNGWVDFYGKSTLQRVLVDTTFVISVSSEPHDIDPTIAGYDKKDPTCTEAGYIKGYCRYCAGQEDGYKELIQINLEATGHTDTDDDGICDVCGESIAQIVDSGTCGSNLTYTLDSNGVLTISGTGDMQNSSFGWDKDLIKSVVINDGVTSIGRSAFLNCTGLTSITIPDSITSIGGYAFRGCTGLTSVMIPDGVTSIGNYAFYGCTGLTSVTIGNSVTNIGDCAFYNCSSLTNITIPDGVTSIGDYAFRGCTGLRSITIPDSVTSIGGGAFYNTAYYNNSSNWENDVLYIGNHLIEAKRSISGAYIIKDGTKTIADDAFTYCHELTSITIPDSVTSIGNDVFSGCSGLTSITVSLGNTVYHSTDNCLIETESKTLISGCKNSIIPTDGSVTSIGDSAFDGCDSLTSIIIPDSVTNIGDDAFRGTSGLTSITVYPGNTVYHSTDNCLIRTESKTLILGCKNSVIPSDGSVTSIGDSAFFSCTGLTGVTIGNSVTSIGSYAFWCCYGLTSIAIPDSVESIGTYAFSYCNKLTEVDFSACTDIPTLESSDVFSNTSSSLVIKVPSALVDEWKVATNWATYADKIVGV